MKKFLEFLYEEQNPPAPAPAPAPQPAPQPTAQPPAQPSGTTQAQAQPPAQPDQTAQQQPQGEQKSGDLSTYNNEAATKFPDTVKKMVDLIKDMDKDQLLKLREKIAELKGIGDAKSEIGKL